MITTKRLVLLLAFATATATATATEFARAQSSPPLLPCAYGKAGFKDPKCASSPDAVGSGASLAQAGTAAVINGGFLRGRELVFTFGDVFEKSTLPLQGAVWAVDLNTGARRILSGFSNDSVGGPKRTGAGPDFGAAYDVKPGPNGSLWVLSRLYSDQTAKSEMRLMQVAPDGTRTLVMNLTQLGSPCSNTLRSLALGPDGSLYAPFDIGGQTRGVLKLNPATHACAPVSQTSNSGSPQTGQGPANSTMRTVLFHGGSLYATDFIKQALWKVNPANGDRTLLSSSNPSGPVGKGPQALGTGWLTAEGSTLWVSGTVVGNEASSGAPGIVEVNLTSGERKTFPSGDGPTVARDAIVPVWKEPGTKNLIIAVNKGILRYEVGGDRNWISASSR